MKILKALLLGVFLCLLGCSEVIKVRKNDESDLKIIVETSRQFYKHVKKMQLDSISRMLNQYEVKPEEAKKVILKLHEGYGNLQEVEPLTASSTVELRNGKVRSLEGNVIVNATYEKAKFKETMTFKLVGDTIKVNSYLFELIP